VARHIDQHLKQSGEPHVLLDLSPIPREHIQQRFPGIHAECAARGLDMLHEPLPVVPAAHYACGGIRTDGYARTSLAGLHAAGEVACTGVHGANRLASNSLLEAVVFSHRASSLLPQELRAAGSGAPAVAGAGEHSGADVAWSSAEVAALRRELRNLMWQDVGIVRNDECLEHAAAAVADLGTRAYAGGATLSLDPDVVELRNLVQVAQLVVHCAQLRRESRGLHYNSDYPYRDNERQLRDTLLTPDEPCASR
jgi:L-aspartate oxidase